VIRNTMQIKTKDSNVEVINSNDVQGTPGQTTIIINQESKKGCGCLAGFLSGIALVFGIIILLAFLFFIALAYG
jgi:hypothetical protein